MGTSTLRFKRWSNRGYAVLLSLRSQVCIGILAGRVADAIGRKSNPLLLVLPESVRAFLFAVQEEIVGMEHAVLADPTVAAEPAAGVGRGILLTCPSGTVFRNGFFYACLPGLGSRASTNPALYRAYLPEL